MPEQEYPNLEFKRYVAHKLRIGEILKASIIMDADRFKFIQINNKNILRINLVANVIDKYIQDDERKFASVTLDDASGQIKLKAFGEDIEKLKPLEQGQTIIVIGLVRQWNNELYVLPEIIKQKDPKYLILRKLETELNAPKILNQKETIEVKDKIIEIVKREEKNNGADIDAIIQELKLQKDTVNLEIKKLLESGTIYEPRPGKVRYLG